MGFHKNELELVMVDPIVYVCCRFGGRTCRGYYHQRFAVLLAYIPPLMLGAHLEVTPVGYGRGEDGPANGSESRLLG